MYIQSNHWFGKWIFSSDIVETNALMDSRVIHSKSSGSALSSLSFFAYWWILYRISAPFFSAFIFTFFFLFLFHFFYWRSGTTNWLRRRNIGLTVVLNPTTHPGTLVSDTNYYIKCLYSSINIYDSLSNGRKWKVEGKNDVKRSVDFFVSLKF